jgi:hypothetical protein
VLPPGDRSDVKAVTVRVGRLSDPLCAAESCEMATTQCPACWKVIEHKPDFTITVTSRDVEDGTRTLLIANGALALHACVAAQPQAMSVY